VVRPAAGNAVPEAAIQKYKDWIPEPAPNLIRGQARNDNTVKALPNEIELRDPRRTAPEKLKTIIRQPVKRN